MSKENMLDEEFEDGDDVDWGEDIDENEIDDKPISNDKDDDGEEKWEDDVAMPDDIDMQSFNPPSLNRQLSTLTLTPESLDKAIGDKIKALREELMIPDEHCLLLLRKYKWSMPKVIEVYFNDSIPNYSDKIKEEAGICINPQPAKKQSGSIECQVCMEDVDIKNVFSLECGHQTTCNPCWTDYLIDGVQSKNCVVLPCPAYKCNVIISQSVWQKFLEKSNSQLYARYLRFCREDFVEHSKDFSFCPGKNCDMIFSAPAGIAREVECSKCKYKFCWACKLESHFPASCHICEQWHVKNSSEAENIQWILAKTKRCPKCGVHIEKNQGCNHMTCRKNAGGCGHEFCWLCKGDWKDHGSATGGYYQCNIYEKQKTEGKLSDEDKASTDAQNELERYEFHWTRFDSHQKSSEHAEKLRETTHDKMHEISQKFGWRLNEAQFLLDAVQEAIICWHVLAWTYPIAYYTDPSKFNLELFKSHQATLEKFCDGLQEKLDFDKEKLGDIKIRGDIIHYTRTASHYRKNLVEYIETEISF